MMRRTMNALVPFLVAGWMAACGGASGGGIGGTGLVVGVIEGLGSVVVDGIDFDTDTAEITIDGVTADAAELELGMVVAVEGEFDRDAATGVADFVRFESLLRGPVEAFDGGTGELRLVGGRVVADADTVLDGVVLDSSIVGTDVEVSGFADAAGAIRATRLAARSDGATDFVLFGTVRDLDQRAQTFRLRTLTVDYSAAQFLGGTAGELAAGAEVRVRFTGRPVGAAVVADIVAIRPPTIGDDGARTIRTSGLVTDVRAPRVFDLDDRFVVRLLEDTEFLRGSVADIAVDVRVAVEGRVGRDRVIAAHRVFVGGRDVAAVTRRD